MQTGNRNESIAWGPAIKRNLIASANSQVFLYSLGPVFPPDIVILEPIKDEKIGENESFVIKWEDSDADSSAIITLYAQDPSGVRFEIKSGISEDDEDNIFEWNMSQDPNVLKDTPYHIVAVISDGFHSPVESISSGTISISRTIGDVSGNGEVTAYDAALVCQHIRDLITLSPEQQDRADVDGDGNITANDAKLILQKVVGFDVF